jgi:hypothetical protein
MTIVVAKIIKAVSPVLRNPSLQLAQETGTTFVLMIIT